VLAATLAASYGILGPEYELLVATPREAGSEEYRDSEKYQLVHWPTFPYAHPEENIRALITRVNRARHDHPALQTNEFLVFHPTDNEHLIAYSKRDARGRDTVLVIVNLDPERVQSGWVNVQLGALELDGDVPYQCHDLLTDAHYRWQGGWNYVSLDPASLPAHLFHIKRYQRTERDFDYFA
jgi:starch synthase (maltosyl-transferring)